MHKLNGLCYAWVSTKTDKVITVHFSNLAKKSIITTLLVLCFSQTSFAKIEKFSPNWQLETQEETGSCNYVLTHIDHGKKLQLSSDLTGKNDIDACSAVIAIEPYAFSPNLAIIDAPSERGGTATLVRVKNHQFFTHVFDYESADEDPLDYKLKGNQIKMKTSQWKKSFILQNNGKIVAK